MTLNLPPPPFPFRTVFDVVIELGAITGAVALCEVVAWGMWWAH